MDEFTQAEYKDIPVSYLVVENDMAGAPEIIQRPRVDLIERVSGRKVDVASIYSSHMMSFTVEKETIEWILSVTKWHKRITRFLDHLNGAPCTLLLATQINPNPPSLPLILLNSF